VKKYPSVRRLPKFEYVAPQTLKEAVAFLTKHKKAAMLLAGGTDLLLNMKRRAVVPQYLVALKNIPDLQAITYKNGQGLRIGALATIHAVETSPDVKRHYPILSQAAATLGSIQIRNLGTVVGNVCSALPSADMVPSLVALGAQVKIINGTGERRVPVEDFITNVGKTVLAADELVEELQVPALPSHGGGTYIKYAQRGAKALGICNVATWIALDQDTCIEAKICLGAVGQTPVRAVAAEAALKGNPFTLETVKAAAQKASEEARPRSSPLRGSAEYRKTTVGALTQRALLNSRAQIE
jgi:carbon-monoxide dehydrogenase medium subunit